MENKIRVSITFSKNVLEKIDKVSKELGINRSATVTLMANHYLRSENTVNATKESTEIVRKMIEFYKDAGITSEDVRKILD